MLDWISANIPPWGVIAILVHFIVLGTVAYLILLERKVASWAQDRLGPNRVGFNFGLPFLPKFHFWGLGQPIADGIKMIVKEDYRPKHVDKILFTLAPAIMITVVIISIAVVPWGGIFQGHKQITLSPNEAATPAALLDKANDELPTLTTVWPDAARGILLTGKNTYDVTYRYSFQIASLNIGVLFVLATLSLAVYGVVIGGWASNNKYSFLGGLRATANMISYEVPLGLAVLSIVVLFGTLDLGRIVELQAGYWGPRGAPILPAWNVFTQPLAFVMFLICIHAEANRAPFDLAEAEQELVGGYHTEYSAMRFGLFFLSEYAGMITTSAVCVALFFGGWHLPWVEKFWPALGGNVDPATPAVTTSILACVVRGVVFYLKTLVIIFIFMWVRWSLPRFRFDQLMNLAWRALIPMSLLTLLGTAGVVYAFGINRPADMHVTGKMALTLLAANVGLAVVFLIGSQLLPATENPNRRIVVKGSRFGKSSVKSTTPGLAT